jgi:peptidoglycan hydrolase CwlO-like protein
MSADAIKALEARAAKAERDLVELQKVVGESASQRDAAIASRLQELLKLIDADKNEAEEIRAQRDELKEENEKLRGQISKLNYRVTHLLRTLDSLENKSK